MYNIDASGLSCPEPIILLKEAIKQNQTEISLIVDNKTSVETCSRYAESQGYSVKVTTSGKTHELILTKE